VNCAFSGAAAARVFIDVYTYTYMSVCVFTRRFSSVDVSDKGVGGGRLREGL
jgi:hypothetical protein